MSIYELLVGCEKTQALEACDDVIWQMDVLASSASNGSPLSPGDIQPHLREMRAEACELRRRIGDLQGPIISKKIVLLVTTFLEYLMSE